MSIPFAEAYLMRGACEVGADLAYQEAVLPQVSRTFALTIPQLPGRLATVVANAYLLCRIADTIEDSTSLSIEEKRLFYDRFVSAAEGSADPEAFAADLAPRLAGATLEAERELVRNAPGVLRITQSFPAEMRAPMVRCLKIMAAGMEAFQEGRFAYGLRDEAHLEAYCYHVAGVVGEMLTELFCAWSPHVAQQQQRLSHLAVSFGLGLQMTNILKDIWDDKRRNACWLPQSVFAKHGFDLATLSTDCHGAPFQEGLRELIGVARGHLKNALAYTLLIPKSEMGIRRFCLWAIGMALLTLRKINRNRAFIAGEEVKISRRSVRGTILATRLIGWSNVLLRGAFWVMGRRLGG